jgi:putative oxidoreductase
MINLFKPPGLSARVSAGLLVIRLVAGLAFVLHGYGKIIKGPFVWMGPDMPGILQALAVVAEFGGGLAWMLGLLTPLASFGLACTMVVAVRLHALVFHDPFMAKGHAGPLFRGPFDFRREGAWRASFIRDAKKSRIGHDRAKP